MATARRLSRCANPWRSRTEAAARCVASLPQIPGSILSNEEIPDDKLVGRVRRWAAASPALRGGSAGGFDLLQISEVAEGRQAPRALCGILRTQLRLAEGEEPVRAIVGLFCRSRDYLNSEFWETQARRLCDIVADEYIGGKRGVQLAVHHNAPDWPLGLEVGDHRLLADLGALHAFGRPLGVPTVQPELLSELGSDVAAAAAAVSGHGGFHELRLTDQDDPLPGAGGLVRGCYVVREGGAPVAGVQVLGAVPMRLVVGGAWAEKGKENQLRALVEALRRRARRLGATLLADARDPHWQRLTGPAAPAMGLWRSRKRLGIAVTGVPVGLTPEEQATLARSPLLVPWEFLPFHEGQVMLI